jgi:hypothetical protein
MPDGSPLDVRALTLRPWQARAVSAILAGERGAAWAGGRGSGKSLVACYIAAMTCYLRPGAVVVLGMDTYPSLRDVHLPFLRGMCPGLGGVYATTDTEWRFANGSVLRMRHLDVPGGPALGRSPLEGGNVHGLIVDEAQNVHQDYWSFVLQRARVEVAGWRPFVAWSGLPVNSWWVTRAQSAGWPTWRPRTRDNAVNLPAGFEDEVRASMTPAQAAAMLDGAELAAEGAILREYVAAGEAAGGHWTDWTPTPAACRFILALDPGIRFPHAILAARDDVGDRWVVLREWAPDDATIGDLARAIRREAIPRREWRPGSGMLPIDELVMDPAGRSRGADGRSVADLLALPAPEGVGMRPIWETDPARLGVLDGIDRVNIALYRRRLMFAGSMMQAGMTAHPDRRTLARCMVGYRFDPRRPGEPLKDGKSDHGCDALRYLTRRVMWSLGADLAASVRVPQTDSPDLVRERMER